LRLSLSSPPSTVNLLDPSPLVVDLAGTTSSQSGSDHPIVSRPSTESQRTPSTSSSSASATILQSPDPAGTENVNLGLGEGFDTFGTNLRLAMLVPDDRYPKSRLDQPIAPSGPALTQALMQASHAECEPGTTADLMSIILRRDNPSCSFNDQDLRHPCKIWWGDEDDKISENSMRWMDRTMGAELKVVRGEGHNLMSCAEVMMEVFGSLARDAKVHNCA